MHHKTSIYELREWSSMDLLELLLTHSLSYTSIQEAHKQAVESLKELHQRYLEAYEVSIVEWIDQQTHKHQTIRISQKGEVTTIYYQ